MQGNIEVLNTFDSNTTISLLNALGSSCTDSDNCTFVRLQSNGSGFSGKFVLQLKSTDLNAVLGWDVIVRFRSDNSTEWHFFLEGKNESYQFYSSTVESTWSNITSNSEQTIKNFAPNDR